MRKVLFTLLIARGRACEAVTVTLHRHFDKYAFHVEFVRSRICR